MALSVLSFQDKRETKLGKCGEEILDRYLFSRNYLPYAPITKIGQDDIEVPHLVDRICISLDKKLLLVAEAKTKASRRLYPDTGINKTHFDEYLYFFETYGLDTYLFFIDKNLKKIYGNFLTQLTERVKIQHNNRTISYPWIHPTQKGTEIVYFPLEKMNDICELSEEDLKTLSELSA